MFLGELPLYYPKCPFAKSVISFAFSRNISPFSFQDSRELMQSPLPIAIKALISHFTSKAAP